MSRKFDKRILFSNITYLLKAREMKVGEFEKRVNVSTGYISRTGKDENTKPGIDFVVKVAEELGVSIDTLVHIDMEAMIPAENYYLTFMDKLIRDTQEDKLEWRKETTTYLGLLEPNSNGFCNHPLFSMETFIRRNIENYPKEVTELVFVSDSFGCNTYINGNCYNLQLKNGATLYLMDICKDDHYANDLSAYAKEIWIHIPFDGNRLICRNNDRSVIAPLVDRLFAAVEEFEKYPRIKGNLKNVIDAYLKDDISDDDDHIPF